MARLDQLRSQHQKSWLFYVEDLVCSQLSFAAEVPFRRTFLFHLLEKIGNSGTVRSPVVEFPIPLIKEVVIVFY